MLAKIQHLTAALRVCLVLTLCVIILGAFTRLSDAGLGCPDWPGCYGQISVPTSTIEIEKANQLFPERQVSAAKAWPEMIHRYFAASLGLLVFYITWFALKQSVTRRLTGHILPTALTILVIAQALLGMWTVTLKLMPIIVLAHLLGGFTLLSLLVLLYAKITQTETFSAVNRRIPIMAALAFGALILQIALGGWTSANYAALMCTSLPICQGDWASHLDLKTAFTLLQTGHDNYEFGVLDYSGRMTIHVSHRIGAIIVTGVLLTLCWMLYRSKNTLLQKESMLLVALLVVQLSLGVSNVLFHLPLSIAVLHNLGGALLLATIVRINYRLHAHAISKKKESQPSTLNLSLKPSIRRPHE